MEKLNFAILEGADAQPHFEDLARLRICVFADFPYLYQGTFEYEKAYLDTFFKAENSLLVLARHKATVVGAATGLPLAAETQNLKKPFELHNLPIAEYFYFSESVLLPAFRGQGAGHFFMSAREDFACQKGFSTACFCAVQRPSDHPICPANYRPLDTFWQKKGYEIMSDIICQMSWQDVHTDCETEKTMQFWGKKITSAAKHII